MAALRLGSGAGGAGTTLACPLLIVPRTLSRSWPSENLEGGRQPLPLPSGEKRSHAGSLFP